MGLRVVHPGTFATVQDLGRVGYRAWGVPVGGSFDAESALLANALVANRPECAVVELTLTGGVYEAQQPLALALAGAALAAQIEGDAIKPLRAPCSFALRAAERLVLGATADGARTYLAVRGGWQTPLVLGSRSHEARLAAGQVLPAALGAVPHRQLRETLTGRGVPFRIVDGPDARQIDVLPWDALVFRVGRECNRMGVRLESEPLPAAPDDARLSSPVAPGSIQIAGERAIVLGVACGTMGGYPLVAQVIAADLGRLGQLRPDDTVRFQRVELADARRLNQEAITAAHARWRRIAALAADGGIDLA